MAQVCEENNCRSWSVGLRKRGLELQVQDMIATDTLVKRAEAGDAASVGGGCWPRSPTDGCQRPRMRRSDSEEVLGSLVVEGMPDRDAAANLEDVPGAEVRRS